MVAGPCGLDLRELWLGHVPRADFAAALATKRQQVPQATVQRASITTGSQRRSWLGACVKWVLIGDLARVWWDTHVTGRAPAGLTGLSY